MLNSYKVEDLLTGDEKQTVLDVELGREKKKRKKPIIQSIDGINGMGSQQEETEKYRFTPSI